MTYKITFINKKNVITDTKVEAPDMYCALNKFIHEYYYIEVLKAELVK